MKAFAFQINHYLGAKIKRGVWPDNLPGFSVDLSDTQVTNADLHLLKELNSPRYLSLNKTQITDDGLVQLAALTKLEWLSLHLTPITNSGIVHLKCLTKLRDLHLSVTLVTDIGIAELQEALPNCKIHR